MGDHVVMEALTRAEAHASAICKHIQAFTVLVCPGAKGVHPFKITVVIALDEIFVKQMEKDTAFP